MTEKTKARECSLDLETRCEVPINNGTWAYAEHASILLVAYKIDDGEVEVWDRAAGEEMPEALATALADETVDLWAHNAAFDRTVMLFCEDERISGAAGQLRRWHCSMAQAYAHALPGALDKLGEALGLDDDKRKLKTGKDLMRLFCIPPPKNVKREWATHLTHPEEWEQFKEYAKRDIVVMSEVRRLIPNWNYRGKELALWQLDQKINERGVCMDIEHATAAVAATELAKVALAARTSELTDGELRATTQRDALLRYLLERHGVTLPDMTASTLERRAEDPNLPDTVRELMANRLSASSISVAKYTKLLRGTNKDGRLRGTLQYCGAARTGRWAGRLVQLQNLPRPVIAQNMIDAGIGAAKASVEDLGLVIGDPGDVMKWASSAIRGIIVAPPGKQLVVADLANIEGRVAAWLAGEEWKLQAFRDFDAGVGPDLYILAYAKAFNVPPESVPKKGPERQIGKVCELMFQYGGGVGAWLTGAAAYGIDLDQMTRQVYPVLQQWAIDEAMDYLTYLNDQAKKTHAKAITKIERNVEEGKTQRADADSQIAAADAKYATRLEEVRMGLPYKTFVTCDAIKRMWRKAHPMIVSYWKELEHAVRMAFDNPKVTFTARKIKVRRSGSWLRVKLPSGRELTYPQFSVSEEGVISYVGVDQYTRNWQRITTYSGKLFENWDQAVSRDQLAYPMEVAEQAGFEIVTHSHDELICEASLARPELTAEKLGELMCTRFPWNEGLPLAAAGFVAPRYRKD